MAIKVNTCGVLQINVLGHRFDVSEDDFIVIGDSSDQDRLDNAEADVVRKRWKIDRLEDEITQVQDELELANEEIAQLKGKLDYTHTRIERGKYWRKEIAQRYVKAELKLHRIMEVLQ